MTTIPVERLTAGTIIYAVGGDFGAFGGFAELVSIEDQGEGEAFLLTLDHGGWIGEQTMAVAKGSRVEFGGRGEPKLLPLSEVSEEALQARIDADDADIAAMLAELSDRAAHMRTLANILNGVPALEAAE